MGHKGGGPQGGAGKCGGALGSKSKKMKGGKKRGKAFKVKAKVTGAAEEAPAEPGFVEVAPSPARRAALLRANAAGEAALRERAEAKAAAALCPVNGTARSGAVMGGAGGASGGNDDSDGDTDSDNGDGDDVSAKGSTTRDARLQFYDQQRAQRRAATALAAVDGVRRDVASLLDRFARRIPSGGAERSVATLRTVLGNAARRGADTDPRFRRLRARNDALWTHVLRHAELRAVLERAGFTRRPEADDVRRCDPAPRVKESRWCCGGTDEDDHDGGGAAATSTSSGEHAGASASSAPADPGDEAALHWTPALALEDELERARRELEALFQGDGAPDATAAETLLARIDEFSAPPPPARVIVLRAAAEEVREEDRGWVLVHDGERDAALAAAREAARAWSSPATKAGS